MIASTLSSEHATSTWKLFLRRWTYPSALGKLCSDNHSLGIQCSRIRILRFFKFQKNMTFFKWHNKKLLKVFSKSLVLNPSKFHILRSVITVIQFPAPRGYGDLQAFITPSSQLHSFLSAFLSKMFDVGDLPVLTFGNCVLKAEWSGLWNYTYIFLRFLFKIQKNMTFYVFWAVAHVFSNIVGICMLYTYTVYAFKPRNYKDTSCLFNAAILILLLISCQVIRTCLQCFDAVGWAAGRTSVL